MRRVTIGSYYITPLLVSSFHLSYPLSPSSVLFTPHKLHISFRPFLLYYALLQSNPIKFILLYFDSAGH